MSNIDPLSVEREHGAGVYALRGLTIVRGEGARVWDAQGRAYIDCIAGHGAAILGHAHPAVVRALAEQAGRLVSCPGTFANDVRAALLARLAHVTGFPRFFLCNSGAEAVEAALKFARLVTGRPGLVAATRGFHGRTTGALSLTWEPKYRRPFEPLLPEVTHVPFNDVEAATKAISGRTAAVIVEPVQGEGGVRPADPEYVAALRSLCDEQGALLIFDEVQTGFGRTGRLFAFQHFGVVPDMVALAKGMAAGVPAGAVAIGPRVGALPAGSHGSTFGGNPLACAAALATLDVLEGENLPARAARLGAWALGRLRRALADTPAVREVRGLGLMVGVELRRRVTPLLRALQEDGVLALPAGPTVVRLLPPLTIGEDDWRRAVETVIAHICHMS